MQSNNNKIKNNKGKVLKGGGIVLKIEDNEKYILLIYRKKQDDWSFPKGHTENNETIKETVVREIKEECGIDTEIIEELIPNKYINSRTKEETITSMYLLKPLTFDIKSEYADDKVEWVLIDDVRDRLSYDNLKLYFDKVIEGLINFEDYCLK